MNNNLYQKLRQSLLADLKKTGALAVLLTCFGVMLVRTVMDKGPGTARAKDQARKMQPDAKASGSSVSLNANPAPFNSSAVSAALQKWADAPVPPLSRNLFGVRIDYFPVDGSRTTQIRTAEEGFWAKLEKSLALQADQRDKRENLIANFKAQAAKLRLESTMMGPEPKAMVNGELVGEGSVVASFRVLKIEARRMIVEREGIRLEIVMK